MISVKYAEIEEFNTWLHSQNRSSGTIKNYYQQMMRLSQQPSQESFLIEQSSNKMLRTAYRNFLKFKKYKGEINREELYDNLDTYALKKQHGSKMVDKWSIPRKEWEQYIKVAPSKAAKFGVWLGFNFGLRVGEIVHLRIQDIDFANQEILIQEHKASKTCKAWIPKHNHIRQIPFTETQGKIIKRWLEERPQTTHSYLIYSIKKFEAITERSFQRWCENITSQGYKLRPHVLRYSFAVDLYERSNRDIKLVSIILGHNNVSTTSEYLALGQKEAMNKARQAMTKE